MSFALCIKHIKNRQQQYPCYTRYLKKKKKKILWLSSDYRLHKCPSATLKKKQRKVLQLPERHGTLWHHRRKRGKYQPVRPGAAFPLLSAGVDKYLTQVIWLGNKWWISTLSYSAWKQWREREKKGGKKETNEERKHPEGSINKWNPWVGHKKPKPGGSDWQIPDSPGAQQPRRRFICV